MVRLMVDLMVRLVILSVRVKYGSKERANSIVSRKRRPRIDK